jgi:uncharacterized protein (DUF58 family)
MKRDLRGFYLLLALLAASFAFGKFQGGFVPWFLFYVTLSLTLYVTAVAFGALRRVDVSRELSSKRLTAGDALRVTVRYRILSHFPFAWLFFREESSLKHPGQGNLVFGLKRSGEMRYTLSRMPRGRHLFKGIEVTSGDLFGFVKKRVMTGGWEEVLVYPRVRPIRLWPTTNDRNAGHSLSINRISENATAVVGVRDYVPGDRLNRIHWKATARGQGLKVKEFEHRTTNDFLFVLDRRGWSYEKERELFERAVSLTASLIAYAIDRRFSAGLISCGTKRTAFPLGRSQDHLLRLFEHLATVEADGKEPLSQTVLRESVYLPAGATLVIVTPLLDDPLVEAVSQLAYRKIKVELFWLLHPEERRRKEQRWPDTLTSLGVNITRIADDRFDQALRGGISDGIPTA